MVLVEVVQGVKARLLLLTGLQRVPGLEVWVLHVCDPAGPARRWDGGKRRRRRKI